MQYRCTVCVEQTIGSEIVLDDPMELPSDVGHIESLFFCSETMLVSVQDRCMIRARHTSGLEIVLDAPDGTTR